MSNQHEHALDIAKEMFFKYAKLKGLSIQCWDDLDFKEQAAWVGLANSVLPILVRHAYDDLKECARSGGWVRWILAAVSAVLGAAGTLLFSGCSSVPSGSVQQWDDAHRLLHAVTGTRCTLVQPGPVTQLTK